MVNEYFLSNQYPEWRILLPNSSAAQEDLHLQFALDEAIAVQIGKNQAVPTLRMWKQQQGIALGYRDTRLPLANDAVREFEQQGWDVVVRTCGGAFVPLDDGVLNVSLIVPLKGALVGVEEGYQVMANVIQTALEPLGIKTELGEIAGAYCPGKYDLGQGNKKFGGIAQRRKVGAVAVQCFLVVEGIGSERAVLADKFYQLASGTESKSLPDSLDINPERLISLNQLTDHPITVEMVCSQIIKVMSEFGTVQVQTDASELEEDLARDIQNDLKIRTKKFLP